MATIQTSKTVQPTTINKFLGLNLSDTGDTQIALGESGNMTNFYITDDYKLRKMYGYKEFYDFTNPVQGLYSANINNNKYLIVISNNTLYTFDSDKLDDNFLVNPKKSKRFKGDGEETEFDLGVTGISSLESINYGDAEINEFTEAGGTISWASGEAYPGGNLVKSTGKVTFSTAPDDGKFIKANFTQYLQPALIGSVGTGDASFFEFDNKVYILCGGYYKLYSSGSGLALSSVEGYIPTVFINTPAGENGGGVIYEEINMLTSKKKQTFNGDGTTKKFRVAQTGIASIISVKVGGTATTAYTADLTTGIVTMTNAPAQGYDNVEITWSKDDGDRSKITGMKFGTVFGGDVDTRVFLYGNSSCQNRTYYSGITIVGEVAVPSVEYFPATAQVDIGPANFAITDLTRQYDRLLATTNKPEAYYMTISTEQLTVTLADSSTTTRYVPSVSTFPLNSAHGNIAPGQGQVLNNNPVTFEDGAIIMWKATNVRDEKNMEEISSKIKLDLEKIPMESAKSLDLQEFNQLWVLHDNKAWIYNYANKTYSRLNFPVEMKKIYSLDGKVYMITSDSKIVKFDESFTTYGAYNDEHPEKNKIVGYWEMNFSDFGVPYLRKTMSRMWVSMQPQNWSSCEVSFISNIAESTIKKRIEYKKQWFDNVDFSDFSFTASVNPQPFRLKLKAKKFTNLKITINSDEESTCTILSMVLQVESFGYSK